LLTARRLSGLPLIDLLTEQHCARVMGSGATHYARVSAEIGWLSVFASEAAYRTTGLRKERRQQMAVASLVRDAGVQGMNANGGIPEMEFRVEPLSLPFG
jgi:hypothetical protein